MFQRRFTSSAAIVLGFFASNAIADESWVGREILAKRPNAALKVGQQLGVSVTALPQPMRVEREQGAWLWIDSAGHAGWLKKDDVVPVEQAIRYFSELLEKEPKNAWAYNLRGLVREQRGELEAAIRDFTEALRNDPQRAAAYNNRGIALDRSGELPKAIADYSEAIKLDPKYAAAFNNRGLARAKMGDLKRAIADFDQAIRFDPKFAVAHNNRGVEREQSGDLAGAEQDFTAALSLDAKLGDAYANRGNVRRGLGKYEPAIADFEQAVRLDPGNAAAVNNRAWLQATCPDEKYRDGQAAIESAKKACELAHWKNPDWLDTLAAAYAEAGQFDEAVETQTLAIEQAPEAQRADLQSRLELYRSQKPFRDAPAK
ncbi:MAG TPA: tetratricopeptide repeat protein [Pirellulales bacterium]|nr:tetratricopeptide repeat protein [Pirellulales bacterium]